MKGLIIFFLVILSGALGYVSIQQRMTVRQLERRVEELQVQVEAAKAVKMAAPVATRVTCPACKGETKLICTKANDRRYAYPCPVCLGKGMREFKVPHGYRLCPDCGGMGKKTRARKGQDRLGAVRCSRCNGTGVIVDPKQQ